MKKIFTQIITIVFALLLMTITKSSVAQTYVTIPGSFQSELGCSGDWQPECDNTALVFNSGNGLWEGAFNIPAGSWEFKVAIDHTWDVNYGADGIQDGANIFLVLGADASVTFRYDPVTHIVTTSLGSLYVTIPGSFQSELGCSGDWQPDCTATDLVFDATSGTWKGIFTIPAGTWEFKVAIDHSWDVNYGAGGVWNGANIQLVVSTAGKYSFVYNPSTHIVSATRINNAVVLAGSFQSEIGCSSDWQPDCALTGLAYDANTNLWKGSLTLPDGHWEFKVAIDNSWDENYGGGGVINGPNINLDVVGTTKVNFVYDPVTHFISYTSAPIYVSLPGSYQTTQGCTAWDPACTNTQLSYVIGTNEWVGTYNIPAGYWEFKVAINNSWDENYGLGGIRDGANIPLDLPFASNITFSYNPVTHIVTVTNNTNTIGFCINKFYDANVNGINDDGMPLADVQFTVSGDMNAVQTTGGDGKICFADIAAGNYTATETVPEGWKTTTNTSQSVSVGPAKNLNFGNVCLGAANNKNTAYWMGKKGFETWGTIPWVIGFLDYLNLKNADGTDFDPSNFNEVQTWMRKSNDKNVAYSLSVQLATLALNTQADFVASNAIVYVPGFGNRGVNNDFADIFDFIFLVSDDLMLNPNTAGNNTHRSYQSALKLALENINNNLTIVQTTPCPISTTVAKRSVTDVKTVAPMIKVWPNPSNSYFTLRGNGNGTVQLRVLDVNGRVIYTNTGAGTKEYRFGESFVPGLYFVEILQNGKRSTFKLVKQ